MCAPPPQGQFTLADHRPVGDIVVDLMQEGYVPSWCTACYRKGRTGEHFMKVCCFWGAGVGEQEEE